MRRRKRLLLRQTGAARVASGNVTLRESFHWKFHIRSDGIDRRIVFNERRIDYKASGRDDPDVESNDQHPNRLDEPTDAILTIVCVSYPSLSTRWSIIRLFPSQTFVCQETAENYPSFRSF